MVFSARQKAQAVLWRTNPTQDQDLGESMGRQQAGLSKRPVGIGPGLKSRAKDTHVEPPRIRQVGRRALARVPFSVEVRLYLCLLELLTNRCHAKIHATRRKDALRLTLVDVEWQTPAQERAARRAAELVGVVAL